MVSDRIRAHSVPHADLMDATFMSIGRYAACFARKYLRSAV